MIGVPLPDNEAGNQFCVGVQRDESPDIAKSTNAVCIFPFCTHESPNLINFDLLARKLAHFGVHDLLTAFANADAKPHDGIAVNAGDALNTANAIAFCQHGDCQCLLFCGEIVCHKVIDFLVDAARIELAADWG
jgi:hypothetical protein